jgi:RNase P subunit RPR2
VQPIGRKPIRRLFWDIETSPNIVLSWRIGRKISIDHENLLHERAIICIGYKWEGQKRAHTLSWGQAQNDKPMLRRFLKEANRADELVAHWGDKFDLPWLRTRCIFHGLPALPSYKTIDTCKIAKRLFLFNSNRLDYIAKFLGLNGKIHTEFDLWKAVVLRREPAALRKMLAYCRQDVQLLEKVYARLSEYARPKTHVGVMRGLDKWTCAHCGSRHIKANGMRITAMGTKQHEMRCRECGKYFLISHRAYLDALEEAAKRRQ